MQRIITFLFLILTSYNGIAQIKEVKNVILMIPDGTSVDVITLSRWYKAFSENTLNDSLLTIAINDKKFPALLSFEEYLCGAVMTHSANGLIAESASAATAMSTGKKSAAGFLGLAADSTPYVTNMELARTQKNMSTGLVFTCEFTHATPAAFSAHCLSRKDYATIKKQMLYNQLDVVFGGGYGGHTVLLPEDKFILETMGYSVFNHFEDMKDFKGNKVWGLFNEDTAYNGYLAFDLDRQTLGIKEPSLDEMTTKAIEVLEKNSNGFFLMVEGSKVDWAAHSNDPVGIITEFLAFEKAVKVALEYAKKNKNTVVIICTDHGNGGISIGNKFTDKKTNYNNNPKYVQYNELPYKKFAEHLKQYTLTGDGFERQFENSNYSSNPQKIDFYLKKYYGPFADIVKPSFYDSVQTYYNYQRHDRLLTSWIGINDYVSSTTYLGWTTKGHTGEDVPLYIYHPNGYTLHGTVDNTQIAEYIAEVLGLGKMDETLTKKYFSALDLSKTTNHTLEGDSLIFTKGNDTYTFIVNTNIYYKNKDKKASASLNLKINNTFYASEELIGLIK